MWTNLSIRPNASMIAAATGNAPQSSSSFALPSALCAMRPLKFFPSQGPVLAAAKIAGIAASIKARRVKRLIMLISIRIDWDYDDFGVAWAFQPMKAETKFATNFTGWKARATFGCGCSVETCSWFPGFLLEHVLSGLDLRRARVSHSPPPAVARRGFVAAALP